jgi:hypothetical protein
MYEIRELGPARLEIFSALKNQIAFSDFCVPAGTIDFVARGGFLNNSLRLLLLRYPGYELEIKIHDGMIFICRNGQYQHSEQYLGKDPCKVAAQWDVGMIGCGIVPAGDSADMNHHMRAVRTPITVPSPDLVKILRTHNFLSQQTYPSSEHLFTSVVDCLRLCELDIRRHGCEKLVWRQTNGNCEPLDEPELSRLVATLLSAHGATRNFDVNCEITAGTGNLDFCVVGPVQHSGLAKIAIEAKKADNSKLAHGFEVQLPEYMARIGTVFGIYLVYWLKSAHYLHPTQDTFAQLEIEKLHPIPRIPTVRTASIDLSFGPSPSKR